MLKSTIQYLISFIIFFSIIFLTCSKDSTGPTNEEGTLIKASQGGTVESPDGLLILTFPKNALKKDSYINIKIVDIEDIPQQIKISGIIGNIYDLKPTGIEFNIPIIAQLTLNNDQILSIVENDTIPFVSGFIYDSSSLFTESDSSVFKIDLSSNTGMVEYPLKHFSNTGTMQGFTNTDGNLIDLATIPTSILIPPGSGGLWAEVTITNSTTDDMLLESAALDFSGSVACSDGLSQFIDAYADYRVPVPTCICDSEGGGAVTLEFKLAPVHDFRGPIRSIQVSNSVDCTSTDTDVDSDGVYDRYDNCVLVYNPEQLDTDDDWIGDACDNCPNQSNVSQSDFDGDGIGDACDITDTDGDGIDDWADNCPDFANPDQADVDEDGTGDACDNCPDVDNYHQTNSDADHLGDACDNCPQQVNGGQEDQDDDGYGDICDNCPDVANPNQADVNNNSIGDACEPARAAFCDDPLFQPVDSFFDVFTEINICEHSTDQLSIIDVMYSALGYPPRSRAMDHSTSFATGATQFVLTGHFETDLENVWPCDAPPNQIAPFPIFTDGFESGDLSAWSTCVEGVSKIGLSSLNIDENSVFFVNTMYSNIPRNDPTNYYQYGFVFDRDGNQSNNYQPAAQFANDFFKDTDYWIVAWYDPFNGWDLVATDAANGTFNTVTTDAQLIFINNTMILIVPRSEFLAQNIGYRMTAFRHPGDWGVGGDWDGDVQPPVADGLNLLDVGP